VSILREIVVAVAGVYALLFVCDAVFGIGEARFDDAYYTGSFYAPRAQEFRFPKDISPAARVSDAFAHFAPSEARPGKRYSSL
jgi:hypothetical protein